MQTICFQNKLLVFVKLGVMNIETGLSEMIETIKLNWQEGPPPPLSLQQFDRINNIIIILSSKAGAILDP